MRGFDHATILSSSFHGQCKERLAQWPPNWVGVCGTLPETLTLFQTKICDFPYPISDLIKNLIPYFRPEALEPCAWPERVTSCYGTCTVDVNIKREMVLSPNDEVASSKKHTQFKARVHKPYPFSDQNGHSLACVNVNDVWNIKWFVTSTGELNLRRFACCFLSHHRSSAHEDSSFFPHLMNALLSKLSTLSNDRIGWTTHSENTRHLLVWVYQEWCVGL